MQRNLASSPHKITDREDKRFAYGIAIFYAAGGAYFAWITVQDSLGVLHYPLRLALGICAIADTLVTVLYLFVFLTRNRGTIVSLGGLMMAALNTHTRMMHPGISLSAWDWFAFAVPLVMILVLPVFWKETGKRHF